MLKVNEYDISHLIDQPRITEYSELQDNAYRPSELKEDQILREISFNNLTKHNMDETITESTLHADYNKKIDQTLSQSHNYEILNNRVTNDNARFTGFNYPSVINQLNLNDPKVIEEMIQKRRMEITPEMMVDRGQDTYQPEVVAQELSVMVEEEKYHLQAEDYQDQINSKPSLPLKQVRPNDDPDGLLDYSITQLNLLDNTHLEPDQSQIQQRDTVTSAANGPSEEFTQEQLEQFENIGVNGDLFKDIVLEYQKQGKSMAELQKDFLEHQMKLEAEIYNQIT